MSNRHARDAAEVPVSVSARLVDDPQLQVVEATEVSVLRLAVPLSEDDYESGTFRVDAMTFGALGRDVLERLALGCQVRVSGTLDVGQSLTPGREHQLGLRLLVDKIELEELDLGGAEPSPNR